jgi:CRISPR-associated endonuclease/helicase Cas3
VSRHLLASADVMDDAARRRDPVYLGVLETLTRAWSDGRMVRVCHRLEGGQVYEYDFAPYFIEPYAVGRTSHVIGWREPPGAIRTFKIERIQRAEMISPSKSYTIPEDFDPRETLADAWGIWYTEAESVEVVLRFHPRVAQRVKETRWHRSERVEEQPDGSLIWRAEVAEPQEMLPWIRGWGADVEVLEPEKLRDDLTKEMRRMTRIYAIQSGATPSNSRLTRLLRCWGKVETHTANFHPVFFHMLDTGHVAEALLCPPASSRWRETLAMTLGADSQTLGVWLPYIVAMHDIGKLSAAFQSQREDQFERMTAEGFSFEGWLGNLKIHHALIGQAALEMLPSRPKIPYAFMQTWRDSIGGHHGYFQSRQGDRQTKARLARYEPSLWQELREYTAQALADHFLPPAIYTLPSPPELAPATISLSGFTILCDWISSDERYFPPEPDCDLQTYIAESRVRVQEALEAGGFLRRVASNTQTSFSTLFPDKHPPRPLQAAVDAIPKGVLDGPCLAIIEAPTGEGKTEAALALAHRIAQAQNTDELYYALPTTATSNQMFIRVQEHLRDRLNLPPEVKLIHGQAFLVEDDLRIEPLDNDDRNDQEAMVRWFTSKKRAILAPFGVGTVDQAELAALNVKHVALRLMGLAGKVVIFDEVHAYDTYMTTIVERLLNWLSKLGTSVVLLSATLSQAQRNVLAAAYGAEEQSASVHDNYPGLWIFRPGRASYSTYPIAYQQSRPLALDKLDFDDDSSAEKAEWLLATVKEGGCACWIANTVARAQQMFAALREQASEDVDLSLLHARFPLEERQRRERLLTEKYGPDDAGRPSRGIVVGTQVLEQSLDLDFDVMVSDLAPIDLLLQRAGRLQRHRRERPARYAQQATLWINIPDASSSVLNLGVDASIYDAFVLQQTWAVLRDRDILHLPDEYRSLIEAIYGITEVSPDDVLYKAWQDLQRNRKEDARQAQLHLIPEPDAGQAFGRRMAELQFEEDETGAAWIVAQTRLGRESVNLIPLEKENDGALLLPKQIKVDLDHPASKEKQLQLLRQHFRVSRPEIVRAVKRQDRPTLFTDSARLKGYYPLWLVERRAYFEGTSGERRIVAILDSDLGLVIETAE